MHQKVFKESISIFVKKEVCFLNLWKKSSFRRTISFTSPTYFRMLESYDKPEMIWKDHSLTIMINHGIHSVASFSLLLCFALLLYHRLNEDTRSARLPQMLSTGPSPLHVWNFHVVSIVVADGEKRNEWMFFGENI